MTRETYLDEGRCGYRQRTHYIGGDGEGLLWECMRPKHGPRTVLDPQGRVVGQAPDHWYRRVTEDDDGDD